MLIIASRGYKPNVAIIYIRQANTQKPKIDTNQMTSMQMSKQTHWQKHVAI